MTLLEVNDLYKWYPQTSGFLRKRTGWIKAVSNVSFQLERGQILGIIGESGSGKSTLARTILRLTDPTQGSISFLGEDITHTRQKDLKDVRKMMQPVFQNPAQSLNMRKTVRETIFEVLSFYKIADTDALRDKKCRELLNCVGLDASLMKHYPHELSIGQQQRVALARALSVDPILLVLDECVSALDISVQAQVLNLLLELHQKLHMSYLFISHDLAVIEHLADVILVMKNGEVVESGLAEEIFLRPKHPYTKLLLSSTLSLEPALKSHRK